MKENQDRNTALVIGASGLVGRKLIAYLVNDSNFKEIIIFSRRPLNIIHPKIRVVEVNFDDLKNYGDQIKGDIVFTCLGTTRKNAGSKEAQAKVDHFYQLEFAKISRENGANTIILVSSIGANPKSLYFYPRIKGILEEDLMKLNFKSTIILRPSTLKGKRSEKRPAEEFFATVTNFLNLIPGLKKYSSIHASKVARVMVDTCKNSNAGTRIIESDEIARIALESSMIKK